jgi:drug/metabolite transporter (DMT)-like permease
VLAVVIPLALLAALFYALSDFLEQRAAQRSAAGAGLGVVDADGVQSSRTAQVLAAAKSAGGTLRRLVRDRMWFAGWAVGTLAYFVQATALNLGSVSVVQALQVTSLIFTLPLSVIGRNQRVGLRDWLGGAAVCLGLVVFLLARGGTPSADEVRRGRLMFLLLLLLAGAATLAVLAALRSGPVRATLLACAAGAAFASSATLVKVTSSDLTNNGIGATAVDWPGYALAGVTLLGLLLQQVSFASGRLPVAATAMVVTNPFVGSVVAVIGFDERLPGDPLGLAGIAVGGALVVLGVAVLAHSPLLTGGPAGPEVAPDRPVPAGDRSPALARAIPPARAVGPAGGDRAG